MGGKVLTKVDDDVAENDAAIGKATNPSAQNPHRQHALLRANDAVVVTRTAKRLKKNVVVVFPVGLDLSGRRLCCLPSLFLHRFVRFAAR
jgi:hypothetical protein